MSESVVDSRRNFLTGISRDIDKSLNKAVHALSLSDYSGSLFDSFKTSDLSKLDAESFYSMIFNQSTDYAHNASALISKSDMAIGEWSNFSSTGSCDPPIKSTALNASSVPKTPAFLPTKVEQLSQQFHPQKTQHLVSELDGKLEFSTPQRKHSVDFLTKLAPSSDITFGEKKPLTLTERIVVPSSDHVAEIVGKNGQRIKHLREQLKVWVKTPSRDEAPVFEITGMPDKLAEAKRIIVQMSDHFTKVQQERMSRIEPNRVEDRLYVDQDKVGLIVGASGQTIRWVQQLSDTHIATPRKQESIPGLPPLQTHFIICGARERVRFAKQLICEYVSLRCQGLWLDPQLEASPEAARLVREFHQRRQVEDTQRRSSAPADAAAAVAAAVPVGSLAEAKRLWQEGGPPGSVWDSVLFSCLPTPPVLQPPTSQQSALPMIGDRRYSADAQLAAQYRRHHQQQLQLQQQQQQQQEQLLLGLGGFDPLSKKSYSDELVMQAGSGVNGWM